jgi:hypothetical protein
MTEREAFISTRRFHLETLIHGNGDATIPFSILRIYWRIATDRAHAYIKRGGWRGVTTMKI